MKLRVAESQAQARASVFGLISSVLLAAGFSGSRLLHRFCARVSLSARLKTQGSRWAATRKGTISCGPDLLQTAVAPLAPCRPPAARGNSSDSSDDSLPRTRSRSPTTRLRSGGIHFLRSHGDQFSIGSAWRRRRTRVLMREARPLRQGPNNKLPVALLDAFKRPPCPRAMPSDATLPVEFVPARSLWLAQRVVCSLRLFALDEHVVLLSVHAGAGEAAGLRPSRARSCDGASRSSSFSGPRNGFPSSILISCPSPKKRSSRVRRTISKGRKCCHTRGISNLMTTAAGKCLGCPSPTAASLRSCRASGNRRTFFAIQPRRQEEQMQATAFLETGACCIG